MCVGKGVFVLGEVVFSPLLWSDFMHRDLPFLDLEVPTVTAPFKKIFGLKIFDLREIHA